MAGVLALPFPIEFWDEADPFGSWSQWRKHNGLGPHRGDDWTPGAGARIPASGAGRVVLNFWNNALGWIIVVEYDLLPGVYFGYCHMQARSSRGVGSRFSLWDTLGIVGNTGSASHGAHLHLTASRTAGDPGTVAVINPMQFFTRTNTAGDTGTPITVEPAIEEDDDMATRPQFWRKTSGPITNSLFLIVYDNGTAVELDGRTEAGMSQVQGIRNQYAQYFQSSVADGRGVPFNEVSLLGEVYDSIRASVKVLTPDYPPFK